MDKVVHHGKLRKSMQSYIHSILKSDLHHLSYTQLTMHHWLSIWTAYRGNN